jgi:hypothetical protein
MTKREVIDSREFPAGAQLDDDGYIDVGNGARVTPAFAAFVEQVVSGRLPDPGKVPEVDPQVRALAAELTVVHLPEWTNPAGRKLAEPTVTSIKQAIRIAAYLVDRGVRVHPELERIRWVPTPGGPPGPYDTGLHITPNEDGTWPVLDPEAFWDVDDIETAQKPDGTWAAAHPRGLQFEAGTKSEAYAGLVERIRAKIEEANANRAASTTTAPDPAAPRGAQVGVDTEEATNDVDG